MPSALLLGRSLWIASSLAALATASCGGGGEASPDAPTNDGKLPPAARLVDCPRTVALEITEVTFTKPDNTIDYRYSPSPATIKKGQVVRFRLGAIHNAVSVDNLFMIDYGGTQCVEFNEVRTFNYGCRAHGFVGSVVVGS